MEIVKLNKICDLKNGFAFKSKDYVDSSNTLSCRMSSIRPGGTFDLEHNQRFLPDNYAELYSEYLLNDGDIVIAMTDLAGDPKILGVPTIVNTKGKKLLQNQRVGKLIVKDKSKVYVPFLQYALNRPSNKTYYKKFAGGGLQINVGKKEILNNTVPLPSLPQQQKIAAILDAADALRQNDKALIAKYDELTQALFLDMFGDPVSNPKGWDKVRFDELVSKDCPLTYGIVQPGEEFENGTPCVRPVDLVSQYIKTDNLKKIDPIISSKFKRTLLKGGELLLSVRGSVGVISIADESIKGSNVTRGIVPIWFDSNVSNKLFFYYLYNTTEIQREIKSLARGATLIQINLKDLREIQIIKPVLSLQNQFADRVYLIEEQKAIAQESLIKSEELFNSLLQKAFKGELV
jgi:type I restriction enzyme S subunit